MDTWQWVVIAVIVLVAVGVVVWLAFTRRRTHALQQRFGPEYDRTLARADSRRQAELDLREREHEHDHLTIRRLAPAARARHMEHWHTIQQHFVDEPARAVADAHSLLTTVMNERGYPVDDFEQQANLVSVDHPSVVDNYRAAYAVYERSREGSATTDELRDAFVCYRSLFEELLATNGRATNDEEAHR